MPCPAKHRPGNAGCQREPDHLEHERSQQSPLCDADRPHHRAAIEMALSKAARSHRDGHRRDQRRQQRDQRQELLGAIDGRAHLGPTVLERLDALARGQARRDPGLEISHLALIAREQGAIGDPARRLHELCGLQIVERDHDARCEIHEGAAAIGLDADEALDPKALVAQHQGAARLQTQALQQGRVDPDRAARGNAGRGLIRLGDRRGDSDRTAQRIALGDRLE